MPHSGVRIHLEFCAHADVVDLIHTMTDHVSRAGGLDEEASHWVGVAVREGDSTKRIAVVIGLEPPEQPAELVVRIIDPGEGFDPDNVADPLAEENLLKPSGRGIFLMRRLMDEVTLRRRPEGGMEVRMVKRLGSAA